MREKIIAGNLYHVLNRGVDKRKIFLDDEDYLRFIHDLFEFNDENSSFNIGYHFRLKNLTRFTKTKQKHIHDRINRKLLVEILAFCLMPNHYHLILRPKKDTGVAEFIKKLNGGYTKYFNNKNQRAGVLFQGKYKSILIKNEGHLIRLPYYIHCNPLDLIMPKWREGEIKNYKRALKFLENYRWSSFPDYIGKKNFPSVTQRQFLLNFLGGAIEYKKATANWLKEMNLEEIEEINEVILE